MIQYIYPAVFTSIEDTVSVFFPDLNISLEGDNLIEAFLFAKDYLQKYFEYANKFEIDTNEPTPFKIVKQKFGNDDVMLVDAMVIIKGE